ncbi:MAG TPA: hypothetical protein VK509_20710, partial [Polyangiales bacterium]|nr:hypothetical protein [Polyangiales bacterium]
MRSARVLATSMGKHGARWLLLALCALVASLGALLPRNAAGQERNFAGSLQTNYLWVATDGDAYQQTFDGFTNEL